jgi:hypothetical protein
MYGARKRMNEGGFVLGLKFWMLIVALTYVCGAIIQAWDEATLVVAGETATIVSYMLFTRRARKAQAERAVILSLWAHKDAELGLTTGQLNAVAGLDIDAMSVHDVLWKMEAAELVSSEWGEAFRTSLGGEVPRRRLYRLTEEGKAQVAQLIEPPKRPQRA